MFGKAPRAVTGEARRARRRAVAVLALALCSGCIESRPPSGISTEPAAGAPAGLVAAPMVGNMVVGRSEGSGYVLRSRPSLPVEGSWSEGTGLELGSVTPVDP